MKIRFTSIYTYIVIILAVYISGSAYISFDYEGNISKMANLILLCLFIPIVIRNQKRLVLDKHLLLFAVSFIVYVSYTFLTYSEKIINLVFTCLLFLFMYMCIKSNNSFTKRAIQAYINVIIFLAVIALIMFIITQIIHVPLPFYSDRIGSLTVNNYFNLYYTMSNTERSIGGFIVHRIQSIFWEPGVFALHLNMVLFYILFLLDNSKINKSVLVIILVNITFTFSTTGIIVATVLFFYWLYSTSKINGKVFLIGPLLLICCTIIFNVYNEKINGAHIGSYVLRLSDLITGLDLWVNNFLLGVGYKNREVFLVAQGWDRYETNGIIEICYTMGLVGVFFYVYPFIKRLVRFKGDKTVYLLFCAMMFIENMSEPFYTMPLTLFVVALEYYCCNRIRGFYE